MSEAIDFYDENADQFARLLTDSARNKYEFEVNMPALLDQCDQVSGKVLDFGCGAGNFTQMLARKDREVLGIDPSPRLVAYAKKNFPAVGFMSEEDFLKQASHDHDLVVLKLVLHYARDIGEIASKVCTFTKGSEEPRVLLSVPHPDKTAPLVEDPAKPESVYVDEIGDFGLSTVMVRRTKPFIEAAFEKTGFSLESTVETQKRLNLLFRGANV